MGKIIQEDIAYIISRDLPWDRLSGKTVLVTGAGGMIPGYIVETLLAIPNVGVYALEQNKNKAVIRYLHTAPDRLTLIIQDVSEPLNKQFDYIIHGASLASFKHFKNNPIGTIMPNVFGTYHLLEHTSNFLFISSPDVYGSVTGPISEDDYGYLDPLAVRSCYGESKRMGEALCMAFHRQNNVSVKIVRPFHTYGPWLNLDDGRVFSDFVSNIINKQDILVKGQGTEYRTFCYLADAVLAIFYVLLLGNNGEAYNIGNDKCEIQIKELAKLLAKLFNRKVIFGKEKNSTRGYPDTTKLKQLGWIPKYSIEQGFKRTVDNYT